MKAAAETGNYIITETAGDDDAYIRLRGLWCATFGDSPDFVDAVYDRFGSDIKGYIVADESGEALSALTCYRCGEFESKPVFVSYAVCTREDARGRGLAGMLTKHVRDKVIAEGGISIVSPAEPSLEKYYADLGYEPVFFASKRAVLSPDLDMDDFEDADDFDLDFGDGDEDFEALSPGLDLQSLDTGKYQRYREAFLTGRPHIELGNSMLGLVHEVSLGGAGLFAINRGDAVCAVSEADAYKVVISELLVNPVLYEISADIDAEIASMIAKHFGAAEAEYSVPGGSHCQSMAAGMDAIRYLAEDEDCEEGYIYKEAYFGFPIE